MISDVDALRVQLTRQVAHWRSAVTTLEQLENFAAPAAWASLEHYLGVALRQHLTRIVDRLRREVEALAADLRAADTTEELARVRLRLVAFRRRYLQTETTLDFYGDAVNTRTSPGLAALLRACDLLAVQSMREVLEPLGKDVPPVLTYIDKGLGASILRAGLRLWDGGSLSPAATIKITRHNLYRPTSLIHETGHQVAHVLGWNEELARELRSVLTPFSAEVATAWEGWASEIAADVFAFVHTGYASVVALHDVLAGEQLSVFRYPIGDPHPIPYLRVLLGVEMCVRFFGAGPWDELARSWIRMHPLGSAPDDVRRLLQRSVQVLPAVVDACLRAPMRAFSGRPIVALVDPRRSSPDALRRLEAEAGQSLFTSPHWVRKEGLRLMALSGLRAATEPEAATEVAQQFEAWMLRIGAPAAQAA
jgi:hypothetical protein